MRSAVPLLSGVASVITVSGQTPPERTSSRALVATLLGTSAMRLAIASGLILLIGIGISIVTTTDPQWWRLHFSQLGTFGNGSAAFFNGSLIVAGATVVVFGRAAARELRALGRRRVRRGTARTAQICFSTVGVNLALVGCVPLNTNGFVHDRVAAGMVLGFATLLLVSPIMMHRMPRRLLLATIVIFAGLFAGAWVFVTGDINLALFEVIAFGAMFAWSGAFLSAVRASARRDAAAPLTQGTSAPAEAAAAIPLTEPGCAAPVEWAAAAPVPHRAPRRPRAHRRVARHDVRVRPPRGCTASAARAASEPSRTSVHR